MYYLIGLSQEIRLEILAKEDTVPVNFRRFVAFSRFPCKSTQLRCTHFRHSLVSPSQRGAVLNQKLSNFSLQVLYSTKNVLFASLACSLDSERRRRLLSQFSPARRSNERRRTNLQAPRRFEHLSSTVLNDPFEVGSFDRGFRSLTQVYFRPSGAPYFLSRSTCKLKRREVPKSSVSVMSSSELPFSAEARNGSTSTGCTVSPRFSL